MVLPGIPVLERLSSIIPANLPTYLVGGAVRDVLLGRPVRDLDFIVPADAIAWSRRIANALNAAFYPLDEQRDTGRIVIQQTDGSRLVLDFALRRGDSLEEDLRTRDFTVNALAYDLHKPDKLIDPLGGLSDLQQKHLRTCSPMACHDDPVRTLRGVRLAIQYGLRILPETKNQIRAATPGLPRVSPERMRDELFRILDGAQVEASLRVMQSLGLLEVVFPELTRLSGLIQTAPHTEDVWEHTLRVVQKLDLVTDILATETSPEDGGNLVAGLISLRLGRFREQIASHFRLVFSPLRSRRSLLNLAAIYHDVGKAYTRLVDKDGQVKFYDHDKVGAEIINQRGHELRLSNEELQYLQTVILLHMRPLHFANAAQKPSRRAVYRFFRHSGAVGVDVCLLSLADALGTYGVALNQDIWMKHLDVIRELFEAWWEKQQYVVQPPPLLTGHDLMMWLGLEPGPQVGELLEIIRENQAAGEINTMEAALELARAHLENRPSPPSS